MRTDKSITDEANPTETTRVARRSALRALGGAVASTTLLSASGTVASDPEPEVRFENQESDGTSITVAYAATDVDAFVVIGRNDPGDVVGNPSTRLNLDAGDVVEDVELKPDDWPLSEGNHQLTARLWESNGGTLDTDDAMVRVRDASEARPGFDTRLVDADPDAGFNYPYFLYAPDRVESDPKAPLLVESNNTGTSTDDFDQHLERARDRIERGAETLSNRLGAPFLVPVFPRPREEPVDWTHYVHQLDDTTMGIDSGPLERVDLQLLRMVEHAREQLAAEDYPVADGIMLNGFSASGTFADRFTVLHPNEVVSVTAGGLNGMAILPVAERDGRELPYHVGVADVEELTGEPFDPDALDEVNQFLYMGAEDDNDTIPYDDAWTDDELRELALDIYGDDMIAQRFPTCQKTYREADIDATFRVYKDTGHTPRPAMDDIVEFHKRSIKGDDVKGMGETITPSITFGVESAGDGTIEFDASRSKGGVNDISRFLWAFGDVGTAVGETVSQEFEEAGEYTITLTIILDSGNEYDATKVLSVDQEGNADVIEDKSDDAVGDGETSTPDDADGETDDAMGDGETSTPDDADGETDDAMGDGETSTPDDADGESDDAMGDGETNTPDDADGEDSNDIDDVSDADNDKATGEGGPGFGVGSALTGIGGAAYLLKRRLTDTDTESK